MIIGSFIFLFIDDIFSNNQLNQWAWKLVYFIIFLIIIINFFVLRSVNASILMNFEYDETEYERSPNLKPLKTLFNNFFILIPITTLIFFLF